MYEFLVIFLWSLVRVCPHISGLVLVYKESFNSILHFGKVKENWGCLCEHALNFHVHSQWVEIFSMSYSYADVILHISFITFILSYQSCHHRFFSRTGDTGVQLLWCFISQDPGKTPVLPVLPLMVALIIYYLCTLHKWNSKYSFRKAFDPLW